MQIDYKINIKKPGISLPGFANSIFPLKIMIEPDRKPKGMVSRIFRFHAV